MSADATGPAMSHADRHDLEKLARWRDGLAVAGESGFPVFAAFLVTGEDRASHDIFRRYRSAFEEMAAGFSSLVIFGQHGASTTMAAMLAELGLTMEQVPALALLPNTGALNANTDEAFTLTLSKGNADGELDDAEPWGQALDCIGRAARDNAAPDFGGVAGVVQRRLESGGLTPAIERALASLGG